MKYSTLGASTLSVSNVCLGTMTWGVQNTQADANEQLDYATSKGVNFIDTAEMYAIPPTADTYGKTEAILGNWLANNQAKRHELVIATKIAGPGLPYIRGGGKMSGKGIISAVDDSLARLKTDYIDLYQLHWPNRNSPHFSKHWPNQLAFSKVDTLQQTDEMLDILQGLDTCVKAGKIRYCGLSDETTWGINTFLTLSKTYDLPRMVSIQNEFSLLHTKDWPYLIENCVHEDIAYLPWSPLATGLLTGKYLNGSRPEGTRWTLIQRQGLFRDTPQSNKAVEAFIKLAKAVDIPPAMLALAWCKQVDGVTSTIIGATKLAQLKENIDAFALTLDADVIEQLNQFLREHPSPY